MEVFGPIIGIAVLCGMALAVFLPIAIFGTYFQTQKVVAELKKNNKFLRDLVKLVEGQEEAE